MSITMTVFLRRSAMPSPSVWARKIADHGFKMQLDPDFDIDEFSGFLPCAYDGKDAGFEYYSDAIEPGDYEAEELARIGERDFEVSFVTHSDFRELMTSIIASAVLCAETDGVLWDTEADEFIPAGEALARARLQEADIQAELS